MPEWTDVPYYQRPAGHAVPALTPRLGNAVDRDLITAIVTDPAVWADGYEPAAVARSWQLLLDGRGGPRDEQLLQRVIWRAVFADYLGEVNGHAAASRGLPVTVPRRRVPVTAVRGRRFAARALRRIARTVDPSVGQR